MRSFPIPSASDRPSWGFVWHWEHPPQNYRRIPLQTLRLAALGMLIGGITSWILARTLNSLLFGVTITDPPTFAGMLITLAAVTALAGYLPSLRISRIDPIGALRAN